MVTNKWPTKEEIGKKSLPELEALQAQSLPIEIRGLVLLQAAHLYNHAGNSPEKIPELLEEVLDIGRQMEDSSILIGAHGAYGWYFLKRYDHIRAFEHMQTARQLAIKHQDKKREQGIAKTLAALFSKLGFNDKALEIQLEVYEWESENNHLSVSTCSSLGALLANNKQYEEALVYYKEALNFEEKALGNEDKLILLENLSIANDKLGRYDEAQSYAQQLEQWATTYNHPFFLHRSYCLFAAQHSNAQQWKESLHYGEQAYNFLAEIDWADKLVDLTETLMKAAAKLGKYELAYGYAEKLISLQRRVDNEAGKQRASKFEYQLDMEKREKEFEVRLAKTRLQTLTRIASDIAHEVQNPLQFVNNFSAFNVELGTELKECLAANDPEGALTAVDDIMANSSKISEYGKRIAHIVDQLQAQMRKAQAGELEVDDHNPHDFSRGE